MSDILLVTALGFFAGTFGTGLGGVLGVFAGFQNDRHMSKLLGFAAGIMLAVVSFDLMPEALEVGNMFSGIGGLVAGTVLVALLDIFLPHLHLAGEDPQRSHFYRAGVVLGLGIAMHNLPEGLAIGAGFQHSNALGGILALTIFVQNIPEGMAMTLPLNAARVKRRFSIAGAAVAGLPMGVGALLGMLFGGVSPAVQSFALAFAAGAMLFITCDELIPEAQALSTGHSATFALVVGVIVGIFLSSMGNF